MAGRTMPLPDDHTERVYAGVLGKIIGVYLGRPFEGRTYDQIMAESGEVWYYVHEKRGVPLVVTDNDISGTFTFLRALSDYGNTRDLSPAHRADLVERYHREPHDFLVGRHRSLNRTYRLSPPEVRRSCAA